MNAATLEIAVKSVVHATSLPACHCGPKSQPLQWRARPRRLTEAWQHRREAIRTNVAQRSEVESDLFPDRLIPLDAQSRQETNQSASSSATSSGMDGQEFGMELATVVNDVKAGDIRLLHVAPLVYWTSYLLMVSVYSKPQLQAALIRMQRRGQELGREPSMGASGKSAWEVLDYGDVVVHVLTPEQRDYYDLESFYGAAEEIDLPFLREEPKFGGNWMKSQAS